MYELLVLGLLMSRDMSGYKLGRILGDVLMPPRKISNGVMYPVMEKLADNGFIKMYEQEADARKTKMAQITPAGRERFMSLMAQPVSADAKRDDVYRFKIRGFAHISAAERQQILTDYQTALQADYEMYQATMAHMTDLRERFADQRVHYDWALNAIDLQARIARTELEWIAERLVALEGE